MPKLTNYTFVEIFDEVRRAGEVALVEPFGMLDIGMSISLMSKVTGLFCNELRVLLIDCRAGNFNNDGDFVDIKSAPAPTVQAQRNVSVTAAVRDLPAYADDWHKHVAAWVQANGVTK